MQFSTAIHTPHPRLLITHLDEVKERADLDDLTRRVYADVKQDADALLTAEPAQHQLVDGIRLLLVSREVVRRTYSLAIAYAVERDERYANRLWDELRTVADFPDWNHHTHFLDTAEMTHAVAVGYDWLYDVWTPDQRAILRSALVRHGLEPGLRAYDGDGEFPWPTLENNWNIVCNGGLSLGALAVIEDEQELAEGVLHMAFQSVPLGISGYLPSGGYPEGVMYWSYATKYLVTYLAALDSSLGDDGGLSDSPGLALTARFPIYLTGPTKRSFNYYDADDGWNSPPELFWLARRYDDSAAGWWGKVGVHDRLSWAQSPAALLWYEPAFVADIPDVDLDAVFTGAEVATMRSSWSDPDAIFVAVKAGDNSTNHGDLDLGSFVLDALGIRWIKELGSDDYNLPGYWERSEGGARWQYYRKRAEGQNTLVVNPGPREDQEVRATGTITDSDFRAESAQVTLELSKAQPDIERWRRSVSLVDGRTSVVIDDDISCRRPSALWWSAHTDADIELAADERTATLRMDGRELRATLLSPSDARFHVRPATPLPDSPRPAGQSANDGARVLAVHLAAVDQAHIRVRFDPAK